MDGLMRRRGGQHKMQIDIVRQIPFSDLEAMIRRVPLKQKAEDGSEIFVYGGARISQHTFHPADVNPTTFYLLHKGLDFQEKLHGYLLREHGIDMLQLDGAVELHNRDTDQVWTLTPPIVEVTPRTVRFVAQEGEIQCDADVAIQIPIIMDGAHRVGLARRLGLPFASVFIAGADPRFPFYAHPNPWSMVCVVDEVPKHKREKKLYSREDCYGLYRDFGVIGCGGPRSPSP
ncbi:hypothetical protein HY478_02680 [Candidatus Uhrbacteria bacterium]|nr:hypothetical protein [Candidatus Uhrbacteria bacterium]